MSYPLAIVVGVLIGLDLDGVLCDLGPGLAARIHERFGIVTHPSAWRTYDLRRLSLGVPEARFNDFLDELFGDPRLYERAPPTPGAARGAVQLLAAGWRLVGITARPPHLSTVTSAWLAAHGIPLRHVVHTALGTKAAVAAELGTDVTVEDNPVEAELLGEVCQSWLLDHPYNREFPLVRARRLSSWDDLVGRLCQLRLFA